MTTESEHAIPTNLRLLLILEEIAKADKPVTPTDVNRALGLPKASIHRLFATLEKDGFIERDIDGQRYSPARRSRLLSANILSSVRLRTARVSILTRLTEEIGETCNIALPDRDAMVYLERVETKWPLRIQLPIGTRVPLYCTASGKLYLSTLSPQTLNAFARNTKYEAHGPNCINNTDDLLNEIQSIRARGYSTDNEEFMGDMTAVSVPLMDQDGRMIATLSTHAPKQRLNLTDEPSQLVELLKAAAIELIASIISA